MQSSGDWSLVPCLTPQHSDDSGSGVDGFSLISASPESNEASSLDLDAVHSMAQPLSNDEPTSETHDPLRPTVVDGVEGQSLHDQTPNNATELQHAPVDSASTHADLAKQARALTKEGVSLQEGRQQARKVYDIPTLLKLKDTQSTVPVMLRIKPEAIAENIFQYMGASTSRRLSARSRGLSDISNISTGNAESHNSTTYPAARPKYMAQPIRQPHAPPENSILQRHDGFVRFLKQHASPPHQRVTAGGRVVPAGPTSPPPMLDFGSLNGLLRDRPATAKSSQKESSSSQSNTRVQMPQATSSMTLGDYLRSHNASTEGVGLQHVSQFHPMQAPIPFNNTSLGCQPFMAPTIQTPSLVPLAMFPDGSTLVSYNGVNYRASWNGTNTSMELLQPFQPLQLSVDQQYYPQAYPHGYANNSQYGVVPQPPQVSLSSMPLASATNIARPETSKADSFLQNEGQNGDDFVLKAKLTNLDEHLALHHYDITPVDRASLIAQRIYLVAELDRIRLSKTKPKHKIPIIAPTTPGVPVTPAAQLPSDPQNNGISKGRTISKHLSPAAPAFVPRGALSSSANSFGIRTTSQQSKCQESDIQASSRETDTASTAMYSAKPSFWADHSDNKAPPAENERKSRKEALSSSNVFDPSDPAMRIITYEDIEYAARYQYNWTKDKKTYCTTVSEFQEAIRRVREQARLYGCAGGQSKDPAYDAEQDLWWAICDRDPIPLPSPTPDHIANPRPWNWNDSAFNYRRQGAGGVPGPECEQARNSPRILGWDPATTDKMKDNIDVSRSYFALKGRLPSVSFRHVAHDRDDNRGLTPADTTVLTAHAAAAKFTTYLGRSPVVGSQSDGTRSISDSKAPKEIGTSELNIQRTSSQINAQLKPVNKGNAHGSGLLLPGVPRTPEHRRTEQSFEASYVDSNKHQSKPKVSNGHMTVNPRHSVTNNGPHHAFVENHAETLVAGGVHSPPKGALDALLKSTPPNFKGPHSTVSMIAQKGSPVHENLRNPVGLSGPGWNPTEEDLNSIWFQTPLDEVTQKYVDDMKAYNPLKNKQEGEDDHHVDVPKVHHQFSNSSEPVAESKITWGPEDCAALNNSRSRNRFELSETHGTAEKSVLAKTAKVKIPNTSPLRVPVHGEHGRFNAQNSLESREFNAIKVPSTESTDSHNFLRKMLKSPRYSSAQPTNIFSQISSALADKINGTKRAQVNSAAQQFENKGNALSNDFSDVGSVYNASYPNERLSGSAVLTKIASNMAVGKAQSSLASSTYQAHAQLPQFEGAGKAHTSSLYREQGMQPLPQVRLPSEDSYADRQHTAEASFDRLENPSARATSTTYHHQVSFGYDGGRDSPPPKATVNSQGQQSTSTAFDPMGVTLADYEIQRGDTNNAWHHGAVDDFFQDLRVQELEAIASHQRINTQSAV